MAETDTMTLDEQVAVEVMGCVQRGARWLVYGDGNQWPYPITGPCFAQSIGQAWLVVEEMERRGWEWSLTLEGGRYAASFDCQDKATGKYLVLDDAVGATPAEAICRAALAAVRSDRK